MPQIINVCLSVKEADSGYFALVHDSSILFGQHNIQSIGIAFGAVEGAAVVTDRDTALTILIELVLKPARLGLLGVSAQQTVTVPATIGMLGVEQEPDIGVGLDSEMVARHIEQ